MSIFDIVIIIMLVFFTYFGARKGLVDELFGFTGLIISFLIALGLCDLPATIIHERLPQLGIFSILVSMVVIFLFARLFIQVIANYLDNSMGKDKQSFANIFGGSILGFIKGLFLLSVIVLTITVFPFNQSIKGIEKQSVLYGHVQKFSVYVIRTITRYIPKTERAVKAVVQKLDSSKDTNPGTPPTPGEKESERKLTPEEIEKIIKSELQEARRREGLRR